MDSEAHRGYVRSTPSSSQILRVLINRYSSDADSDVLAEYVIALLKHDGDPDAVRKLCEQEIPDFLSEGISETLPWSRLTLSF